MEIKTKFNVGDKVWWIDFSGYAWRTMGYEEIKNIRLKGEIKGYPTMYSLKLTGYINEQNCFATKEEAEKECDKRNGSGRWQKK